MPTTHPSAPSVRPLRAGEVGPLIEVFDRLSAQSRFLRFNAPLPRLTALMVEQLTAQEEGRHEAFVASVDGMAVGIGPQTHAVGRPCGYLDSGGSQVVVFRTADDEIEST